MHSKRARRCQKMHDGALHQGHNHYLANEAITDLDGLIRVSYAMTELFMRNDTLPNEHTCADILIQAGVSRPLSARRPPAGTLDFILADGWFTRLLWPRISI